MGLKILLLLSLIVLNSCQLLFCPEENLSFKKTPYYGNDLKLKGYYYHSYDNNRFLSIYFFYRNSVVYYLGSFSSNDWKQNGETHYQNITKKVTQKNIKYCWGLFVIRENYISFEKWYPSDGPDPIYIRSGHILNDTTFIITQSMRPDSTEVEDEYEIYHFKQFSPKPDSTSKFIEQQFYK